ncbi:hypothetical protein M0G74_05210 [Microbulbifer sp. CAU 1566]|uniref:hypothetical protein n=1 Tax=Microbulbifer sp. CAU 1566 TaxID=2933269 RepID=UPI00200435D5|nr:hypothetical protein [Microbulbifer sp. CAU 1566]MCK7596670.1 hypothetical protein [Microbulbifer sp. CAU 1566]
MRQLPYRLLAALTITLTLGGCVTYPAAPPVIGGSTYVRKAPPVYSYSVITDPGYRYYDDTLGVYVFYDRSDVFYRQGRYYRWYQDHWISASHWGGRWYPAPNFYISANFNDRWHTRLRRHGQRYAGGHDYRPLRRNDHDDGYNQRDRDENNGYRHDRRGQGQDRGRGGEHGFAGAAESKGRASQVDNRSLDNRSLDNRSLDKRREDRRNERPNPRQNPSRDERVVKVADKPTGNRVPRVVPAVERPATDRRTVSDRPKPQTQRGQPQRNAPKDRRNTAAKPAPPRKGKQPKNEESESEKPKSEQPKKKKKEKKSKKKTDKRDQVSRVREPLTHRSNEARRQID